MFQETNLFFLAAGSYAVCRQLDVSENTYYRWRKECGGLDVKQARRLEELEKENARLKKLLADQALDIAILKEANPGNSRVRRDVAGRQSMFRESSRSRRAGHAGC